MFIYLLNSESIVVQVNNLLTCSMSHSGNSLCGVGKDSHGKYVNICRWLLKFDWKYYSIRKVEVVSTSGSIWYEKVYNELDLNYVFFQWLFVMIYLPIENQ